MPLRRICNSEQPVAFYRSFDKIAGSAVIADSSPFFKMGIHDRVFAGMANHTAVLTDESPYRKKVFGTGQHILDTDCPVVLYSPENPQQACDMAEELLIRHMKFIRVNLHGIKWQPDL